MKRWEKIMVGTILVPLAALTMYTLEVLDDMSRPKKPVLVPRAVVEEGFRREVTFATKNDVDTRIQPIPLEEIISETINFSQLEINTDESRRSFCIELFKEAGYTAKITDDTIYAVKEGASLDYIAIGSHYDKVEGPSEGILDNMLGCILISNLSEILKNEPTNFTYLFLTYGDEEKGRKIGSAISHYRSDCDRKPTYVIEIDYVGDKHGALSGRWLSPSGGRFSNTGMKITTYPLPQPPTMHTKRDNIDGVNFNQAHLAYKTVLSLIEGIEKGDGLNPPDTINFFRKDKPLKGQETP